MRVSLIAGLILSVALNCDAQVANASGASSLARGANASESQIQAGLKEVLSIASTNAVRKAGVENGFTNSGIKIPLPEKLLNSEKGLRLMGQGLQIEEFELWMNRIAEAAAPAAAEVFSKAIADKKFSDVRAILNGEAAAATDDLRRSAFPAMVKAFRPNVASLMGRTEVQQQFNTLAVQYTGLTLGDKCELDLTDYLTRNILAGLFVVTSQQEVNIRGNSEAQSDLIKTVFSVR